MFNSIKLDNMVAIAKEFFVAEKLQRLVAAWWKIPLCVLILLCRRGGFYSFYLFIFLLPIYF